MSNIYKILRFILVIKLLVIGLVMLPLVYLLKTIGEILRMPWLFLVLFIEIVNQKK